MRHMNRKGMMMVVAMVAMIVVAALGAGYLATAQSQATRARFAEESVRLLNVAEAGVSASIRDVLSGNTGALTDVAFGGDGAAYTTSAVQSGTEYTITSTGSNGKWSRTVQVVIEVIPNGGSVSVRAAVEANTDVTTGGNFTADGRDYNYLTGALSGDPGVYGISTTGNCSVGGSSQVGGNGQAPTGNEAQCEENAFWGDYNDNDGDSQTDEETWDGIDNDGDGQTDEDTGSYPANPDARLGLPSGSLKAAAQSAGTYFTSGAAFETWLGTVGGSVPGGSIIYVEAAEWTAAEIGSAPGPPSIFVCHNSTGTMEVKNIHGKFCGLFMPDYVEHTNAGTEIWGAVVCGSGQFGNAFGNGNATVYYSSNALSNLPTVGPGTPRKKSWVETTAP